VTGDEVVAGQERNLAAIGFVTTDKVLDPVKVDPLQALKPGLQVVGGPFVTDAGPDGTAKVRMIATYSPPDLPEATTADGLPVGSVNIKENPSGKVHWSFGAVTGYHDFSGSDLRPYIVTHSFGVGVHHVTARILDANGTPVTTHFTVHVYPMLRVALLAGRVVVRGGDGRLLATRWDRDRRGVTITDGTGSTAVARLR
jgi:hypothetical protein